MKKSIVWLVAAFAALWSSAEVPLLINYQGRLVNGTNLVNGTVGLSLRLFNVASGGAVLFEDSNTTSVVDGLYVARLGENPTFGDLALALTNAPLFLEVMIDGSPLAPRERVTAAAYAISARDASTLDGIDSAAFATGMPVYVEGDPVWNAQKSGYATGTPLYVYMETDPNWTGASNLYYLKTQANSLFSTGTPLYVESDPVWNAQKSGYATGTPLYVESDQASWKLSGNAGTTSGVHFVGTTDAEPFQLRVNNLGALRIEADATSPRVIGGHPSNTASGVGSVVSGGGNASFPNKATGDYATIGGGRDNTASGVGSTVSGGGSSSWPANEATADYATVGGGAGNRALGPWSTVAGGDANWANGGSYNGRATVGGGSGNAASGGWATIGGGQGNLASGSINGHTTVGGGNANTASGGAGTIGGGAGNEASAYYATVPGGGANTAGGDYSFAAGRSAKAYHAGSFVWGDSTLADVESTNDNSVTLRASGGYRLFSDTNLLSGVELVTGSGSWTSLSDRHAKEHLVPVDSVAILEQVMSLPIATWNYKSQDDAIRHIGPMAQDFYAAFGVGDKPTGITSVDADGVALAAIQALYEALQHQQGRIQALESELQQLRAQRERADETNAY